MTITTQTEVVIALEKDHVKVNRVPGTTSILVGTTVVTESEVDKFPDMIREAIRLAKLQPNEATQLPAGK